jgi:transcriptional regulator with XRE-family HTH domain
MIADCSELVLKEGRIAGRCPAWGGRILADITLADEGTTAFVTVQPHGVKLVPESHPEGQIEKTEPEKAQLPEGMELIHRAMESPEARRLEEARIVVVGGAGMGNMQGFGLARDLAASLGGEVGATRPPVLYHWVEEERMIGQTGKTVRPDLLFTIGTSGAIQYTAGIMEAQTIVAVNRDANAPIFELADIGIVADASTFLPLLTKKVKQVVMRRLADAVTFLDKDKGFHAGGFGALVRRLREARNWSAEELARKTGQTPDFISQVEADQMSPPVGFIINMARAMEVDPGTFLNKEEQSAIRDRRAQAFQQRTRNYSYTTLTPDAENSHLRAFMVTIEPHLAHKPVAYKHEGEEFIFVMGGELEFTLGSKTHVLKEGESIHFNSDIPHKLKSLSNEPTKCLVVLYTI